MPTWAIVVIVCIVLGLLVVGAGLQELEDWEEEFEREYLYTTPIVRPAPIPTNPWHEQLSHLKVKETVPSDDSLAMELWVHEFLQAVTNNQILPEDF